jgi:hypothetical protein
MKEIQSTMICCMMLYKQDGGILHSTGNLENPGKYSRSEVSSCPAVSKSSLTAEKHEIPKLRKICTKNGHEQP